MRVRCLFDVYARVFTMTFTQNATRAQFTAWNTSLHASNHLPSDRATHSSADIDWTDAVSASLRAATRMPAMI